MLVRFLASSWRLFILVCAVVFDRRLDGKRVAVAPEDFLEQRMTLPKDQVDPDAAVPAKILSLAI